MHNGSYISYMADNQQIVGGAFQSARRAQAHVTTVAGYLKCSRIRECMGEDGDLSAHGLRFAPPMRG